MQVTMQHAERLTLAEMREFLCASSTLCFAGTGRKQIYGLVEGVLHAQKYLGLSKKDKGIVRLYLVKIAVARAAPSGLRGLASFDVHGVFGMASLCPTFPNSPNSSQN